MAIFNQNKLRSEEKIGNFQPGDFEDESFQLENLDSYPGTLPSFEFEDNSISEMVAIKEGRDFIKPVPKNASKRVAGGFEVDNPDDLETPQSDQPFVYGTDDIDYDDEDEGVISRISDDDSDQVSGNRNFIDNDDDSNPYSRESNADLSEIIDPDLRFLLENDLGKKKKTLDDLADLNPIIDTAFLPDADDFNPEEHETTISFDEIKADRPSKYNPVDENGNEISDENDESDGNGKKEKKKRKPLALWQIISLTAAAVVIILVSAGMLMLKYVRNIIESKPSISSNSGPKAIVYTVKGNENKLINNAKGNSANKPGEITPIDSNEEVVTYTSSDNNSDGNNENNNTGNNSQDYDSRSQNHQSEHNSHNDQNQGRINNQSNNQANNFNSNQNNNKGHEPKTNTQNQGHAPNQQVNNQSNNHSLPKNPVDQGHQNIANNKHVETLKIDEPKLQSSKSSNKETKHDDSKPKVEKVKQKNREPKEIKEPKEAKIAKNKSKDNESKEFSATSPNKDKEDAKQINKSKGVADNKFLGLDIPPQLKPEGEFKVQVYSTPSKEDAEDWRRKLKAKNLQNLNIDTHRIKDVVWYRVRYGKFKTKDEAKSDATKNGFVQSWVDRIK